MAVEPGVFTGGIHTPAYVGEDKIIREKKNIYIYVTNKSRIRTFPGMFEHSGKCMGNLNKTRNITFCSVSLEHFGKCSVILNISGIVQHIFIQNPKY